MKARIERAAQWMLSARKTIAFTGAGVSTASGIPDFRSAAGLWSRYDPADYATLGAFRADPVRVWEMLAEMEEVLNAQPNPGHEVLARMERNGALSGIVTQNIDGLHQASGVPADRVIELHGNTTYAHCLSCGQEYDLDPIRETFLANETLPVCGACGGVVKTATVSFGQSRPEAEMRRAKEESVACDLFLAVGSSLVVYPAAGFPALAKESGATLAIVNREPTDLDDLADLVINAEIGPTLNAAVNGSN